MAGTMDLRFSLPRWYTIIMARIPLSGERGRGKFAIVDNEDVEKVAGVRWHLSSMGYAVNRNGGKTTRMHRLLNRTPVGLITDHRNGNPLDNRKVNLRSVTQAQNAANRHNVVGYCWDASKNKWMVRYHKTFYGRYDTELEAKRAYKLACSGVPYQKSRRKLWMLPTGVSKQFGKYRVQQQKNGVKYWLGAYTTIDEAKSALKVWKERG